MQDLSEVKANRDLQLSVREALSSKRDVFLKESQTEEPHYYSDDDDDEASFDVRSVCRYLANERSLGISPPSRSFVMVTFYCQDCNLQPVVM